MIAACTIAALPAQPYSPTEPGIADPVADCGLTNRNVRPSLAAMHIEPRLLVFTKGVRWRIAGAVGIGLLSVGLGVARLGLLGWLIGQVFAGRAARRARAADRC